MTMLRVIAFACVAVMLSACRFPGDEVRPVGIPGDHTLRAGESLALPDGSRLSYVRLLADSRCRPQLTCIRAGDADIELRWAPAQGNAQSAVLNSDPAHQAGAPNSHRFGVWQVRLVALDWTQPPLATLALANTQPKK